MPARALIDVIVVPGVFGDASSADTARASSAASRGCWIRSVSPFLPLG